MNENIYRYLLLSSPALCGVIVALVNSEKVNGITENVEGWLRRRKHSVSEKKSFFPRWVARPPLSFIVLLCDWTDSLSHRGLKNGIRTSTVLYVFTFWIMFVAYAFIMAVGVAIAVVLFVMVMWVVGKLLRGASSASDESAGSTTDDASFRPSRSGQSFFSFARECRYCRSKNHASDDCPHDRGFVGIGAKTECEHCGSEDHASDDCPHDKGVIGIGARDECRFCRSKNHSSDDCPHDKGFAGIGAKTECEHCGSVDHASDDCPHDKGFLGIGAQTKCRRCGSKEHSHDDCPH